MISSKRNPFIPIILAFTFTSLIFSVTNIVPISGSMILLAPVIPFILFMYGTYNKVFVALFVMLLYFIISILIYSPSALLQFDFYRRDGNVFITLIPLFMLSLLKLNIDVEKVIKRFVIWVTSINGSLVVVFLATGGTIFFYEPGIYHFLFESHNAAGGFLAMITAISFSFFLERRNKLYFFLFLINAFSLYLTDSRGSLLAVIAALLFFAIRKKAKIVTFLIVLFALSQVILMWYFYDKANPNEYMYIDAYTFNGMSIDQYLERGGTFIARAYYIWPRAIYLFLESPIFGTGFGSVNDRPFVLQGIEHVFMTNHGTLMYNDGHAHHTFLHVLAETGLLGLTLLIVLMKTIWNFIKVVDNKVVKNALICCFWIAVFSSVTEHRFFTPSQMTPFIIMLGLSIAAYRYKLTEVPVTER